MTALRRPIVVGLLALAVGAAAPRPAIEAIGGWIRPAAAGMNGAGYLTLVNRSGRPDRVIAAASPVAARVTLHQSRRIGGVMTMDSVPSLTVPANGRAVLAPGGYHLMFERLARPLRPGDHAVVTLTFGRTGPLRVRLVVGNIAPGTGAMRM